MQTSRSFNGCENEVQTAGTIWLNRWQILLQNSTAFNTWIHLKSSFQPKCDALPLPSCKETEGQCGVRLGMKNCNRRGWSLHFWHSFDIILTLPAIAVSAALHPLGLGFFACSHCTWTKEERCHFALQGCSPWLLRMVTFTMVKNCHAKMHESKQVFHGNVKAIKCAISQLVNWLISQSTNQLIGQAIDQSIDWSVDNSTNWQLPISWITHGKHTIQLISQLTDWLINWLFVNWSFSWLICQLIDWSVNQLISWSTDQLTWLINQLTNQPIDWLIN